MRSLNVFGLFREFGVCFGFSQGLRLYVVCAVVNGDVNAWVSLCHAREA